LTTAAQLATIASDVRPCAWASASTVRSRCRQYSLNASAGGPDAGSRAIVDPDLMLVATRPSDRNSS
jgi:hypothetical protein